MTRSAQATSAKEACLEALASLVHTARTRFDREIAHVSLGTALDFVRLLPEDRMLPIVGVDEDGDVLLSWPDGSLAITIVGDTLHVVVQPGSQSLHLVPVPYEGRIPTLVLERLPPIDSAGDIP